MNASKHAICPICHSDHTLGGRCDCQQVEIRVDLMPRHESDLLARTVLKATAKAFEDPAVRADYDRWKAERQQKAAAK